jgi:hypothetical protein
LLTLCKCIDNDNHKNKLYKNKMKEFKKYSHKSTTGGKAGMFNNNKPKINSKSVNVEPEMLTSYPSELKSQILESLIYRSNELTRLKSVEFKKKAVGNNKAFSKKTTTTSNTQSKNEESLWCLSQKRPLSATSVTIGERLYMKGLASRDKSNLKLKRIGQTENEKILKDCTFSPRLNNSSVLINLKKVYSPKQVVVSKSKISKSKSIDEGHNSVKSPVTMRKVRSEKEIDVISEKMYRRANTLQNKKENLRNKYYSEVCTFKPEILDKTKPNVNKFFSRLQNWIERRNEQHYYHQEQAYYDTATGQRYFQPKVINASDGCV